MTEKISKSNADWETIEARLSQVKLSDHELIKAQAHLARAEAVADALAALASAVKRALKHAFERPYHHPNTSAR